MADRGWKFPYGQTYTNPRSTQTNGFNPDDLCAVTSTFLFKDKSSVTTSFPLIDPIPLPAPVWLLKTLHILTLSLHFAFLHLLLGGLVLAIAWNILGHALKSAPAVSASGVVASRLTIVTTFVINLGIPPLLFTQALYGQAFFTSSILIGAYWITVLFAIIVAYSILYRMAILAKLGRPWWFWGLLAILLLMHVGRVYTTNMTLMLTPEFWPSMYQAGASGNHIPPFDPTRWPRFAVMMIGSLAFGALGTSLYTSKAFLAQEVKVYLRFRCGVIALVALPLLAAAGWWAYRSQPEFVQNAMLNSQFHRIMFFSWPACLGLSFLAALGLAFQPRSWSAVKAFLTGLPVFLSVLSFVILRDGVRDFTLAQKGFDVWASPVNTNWVVVGLFLGFFAAGLVFMVWLLVVLRRAIPAEEHYV
jgi:hypothetical protein